MTLTDKTVNATVNSFKVVSPCLKFVKNKIIFFNKLGKQN